MLVLLFSVFVFWSGQVEASNLPTRDQVYRSFCDQNFEKANLELAKADLVDKDHLPIRLVSLLLKERQRQSLDQAKKISNDFSNLTEVDRVYFAYVLLSSRSHDVDKIKNLLNFQSSNVNIESFRIVTESYIDEIEGRREVALQKRLNVVVLHSDIQETILIDLFSLGAFDRNAELILKPYFGYIEQIKDDNPDKYTLLGWKEYVLSKEKDPSNLLVNFKKAYELCPIDPLHAINYVSIILNNKQYEESEKILLSLIDNNEFYSPYVDLFLAQIYFEKNEVEKTKVFLTKANENRIFFDSDYRMEIDRLSSELEKSNWKWIFYAVFIIILLLVAAIVLRRKKRSLN